MKIKEVIVVEGKDDINAVKRAVEATVIITNGLGIREQTLKEIEKACISTGVIILTDPDYPGEKIRSIINNRVPGCKQAFISQAKARCQITGKIGVEYAKPQDIKEALLKARAQLQEQEDVYTMQDLFEWNLIGSTRAGRRRQLLGEILGIGKINGKQFLRRLNSFNIPFEELQSALLKIEGLEDI